jgi:hypothetical protein
MITSNDEGASDPPACTASQLINVRLALPNFLAARTQREIAMRVDAQLSYAFKTQANSRGIRPGRDHEVVF